MAEHTPGPWAVSWTSIVTQDGRHCICVLEDDGGYEAPASERQANARLVAACPDLLQALKVAEAHLGWGDATLENVHRIAREAIARATESPT